LQNFIIALLESSITMSVLALVYIAITPLLFKKFSAKGQYYASLVIILGLIIPFRFYPQTSVIYMDSLIPALKMTNSSPIDLAASGAITTSFNIPWYTIACSLWLAGVIVFLVHHLYRHRRFVKMVRRWSTVVSDQQTLHIFHEVQKKLGITRLVALRVCPGISSPMLLGFARPTILLPSDDIPVDELPLILKHELIHYKRRDLWYKTLVLIATALHWFNPFVYIIAREISIQCEISCDEEVVKDTDKVSRQLYVEAIFGIIRKQSQAQTVFSTNFYGGKQGMKDRILSIMDTSHKKWGVSILTAILVATFSTGAVLKLSAPKTELIQPAIVSNINTVTEQDLTVNQSSDLISPVEDVEEVKEATTEHTAPSNDNSVYLFEIKTEVIKDKSASEPSNPRSIPSEVLTPHLMELKPEVDSEADSKISNPNKGTMTSVKPEPDITIDVTASKLESRLIEGKSQ
jgi:bla regulator protein blaR1